MRITPTPEFMLEPAFDPNSDAGTSRDAIRLGQAAGRGKLADLHTSPDYIAGVVHYQNGVRGIYDCGAGAPDVPMHPWAALVTVAGTPPEVLATLRETLAAALAGAELRTRAEQAGFELTPSTPDALRARIRADSALYAPLVSEGRIARL